MQYFKSSFAVAFIALFLLWNSLNEARWNAWGVMVWDVACYYGYLTKTFNHKTDELTADEERIPGLCPSNKYVTAPNGNKVFKTTMGMAVLYAPFYAIAYLVHTFIHGNPGTGVEVEYRAVMQFTGTLYMLLALLLLRYFLRKYFTDAVTALTLLLVVLGTNALYYTTYEGCMTHVPDMFLFLLFIFLVERWYKQPKVLNTLAIGLLMGLLTLIRPTNALIGIFFPLYGVFSFHGLRQRLQLLFYEWHLLLLMAGVAAVVWIPQITYWYNTTGQYFFFSYVGERFFFDRPQIFLGMLGGRKGWLIYTPMGWFMLLGFFFMYKRVKEMFYPALLFYVLHVWVIFSWWCWWYGGSFSCRPMVEAYSILTFPFASLLKYVYGQKRIYLKLPFVAVLGLLLMLNIFQTWQYKKGVIHYSNMNYNAYRQVFLKTKYQPDSIFTEPPRQEAARGIRAE